MTLEIRSSKISNDSGERIESNLNAKSALLRAGPQQCDVICQIVGPIASVVRALRPSRDIGLYSVMATIQYQETYYNYVVHVRLRKIRRSIGEMYVYCVSWPGLTAPKPAFAAFFSRDRRSRFDLCMNICSMCSIQGRAQECVTED